MSKVVRTSEFPWYRQVNRQQWRAFSATFFGWLLDGFDFTIMTFILIDIQASFTVDAALAGALPGLFMEEEGHSLHRGLQQAEGERRNQIARDGIRHQGGHADVDHVIAAGLGQRGQVMAGGDADAGAQPGDLRGKKRPNNSFFCKI